MLARISRVLALSFLLGGSALCHGMWAAQQPPRLTASAARQVDALVGIKTSKSAVQGKIDSRLFLGLLHRRGDSRLAPLTDFRFVAPEADGRVPVDVVTMPGGDKAVVGKLASLGAEVTAMSHPYRRVSARVRLEDLEVLAALPEVRKVRQAMPALTHAINVSEGDKTHGADQFRSFWGADGTGVKVCVISDGVDSLPSLVASGDLPPGIDVFSSGSGDEGSGMLEIIHDLAPGAALGFASGLPDEATLAQSILTLAGPPHDCGVIVDDISYLDESPFQDGPVAQAVDTATAAGVLYFSAAGNEGNKDDLTSGTWEGDFHASAAAAPAPLAGAELHDFGDGGLHPGGIRRRQSAAAHLGRALRHGHGPGLDRLRPLRHGRRSDHDLRRQHGRPGRRRRRRLPHRIHRRRHLRRRAPADRPGCGRHDVERPDAQPHRRPRRAHDALATSGATRGHSAVADAFSVAATPAAASFDGISAAGPYPGLFNAGNESESFTSDGPRRLLLSPTGAELTPGNRTATGGVVRQKPDFTAADGVSTAAGGLNPFYGTSAAAAHAAALGALLESLFPFSGPAQIRSLLVASAIDVEAPGTDRDTGAGILTAGVFGPLQAFLTAGAPAPIQVSGDGDPFVEPYETWSLAIPLTNQFGIDTPPAAATAITAVLTTSTPGVTIGSPASSYPDLAPGATASNLSPFVFTVTATVPCGGLLHFTLTVTYSGGPSPRSFDFSLRTGAPGTPVTFSDRASRADPGRRRPVRHGARRPGRRHPQRPGLPGPRV